jgi:hypothetical protein
MKLKIKTDFDKLARAFEKFPEETRKMVRIQLKEAAEGIKERASSEHRYTSRSGNLERRGVVYQVEDNVAVIALNTRVPYGLYVHEGTKPKGKGILPGSGTFWAQSSFCQERTQPALGQV